MARMNKPEFIIDQLTGQMVHHPEKLEYVGNLGSHAEAARLDGRILCVPLREPEQDPQ